MFLNLKYSGYNRHGEQSAAGQFLILMQPDLNSSLQPSVLCRHCGKTREGHPDSTIVPACSIHGAAGRLRRLGEMHLRTTEMVDAIWNDTHDPSCPECGARDRKLAEAGCVRFEAKANPVPIRAIVRYVRMRQLGHFMMGSARVGKTRLSLSGSYGSDGLPVSVPDEVYLTGTPLPQELYDAWNNGGGWNDAGRERVQMERWAKETLLAKPAKPSR
jgi:hypothetical protein